MKTTNFTNWLDTLIEEKEIDLEETFEMEAGNNFHIMEYAIVVESIKNAPAHEQAKIKDVIVQIDFKNGDVRHFFRHLAQALVA